MGMTTKITVEMTATIPTHRPRASHLMATQTLPTMRCAETTPVWKAELGPATPEAHPVETPVVEVTPNLMPCSTALMIEMDATTQAMIDPDCSGFADSALYPK